MPAEAILPDTDGKAEKWLELNADFSVEVAEHHPQGHAAGRRRRVEGRGPGKFEKYFSPEPGKGE